MTHPVLLGHASNPYMGVCLVNMHWILPMLH